MKLKTLNLRKFNRVNRLLLGAAVLLAALAVATTAKGGWTRLRSEVALVLQAQTTLRGPAAVTTPANKRFYVRNYGGKCLAPPTAGAELTNSGFTTITSFRLPIQPTASAWEISTAIKKDDLFLATGAAWYYAPEGKAEWRFLNAQADGIDRLRFGDFDGDGRTDVLTQHGRNWDVSWGGASKWEKINVSPEALSDFATADFDGDQHADVFYASGSEWVISFRGIGEFTHVMFDARRVSDLGFGDFNGDGMTDVFGIVDDYWEVVYSDIRPSRWIPLRPQPPDPLTSPRIADVDGDGRDDIAATIATGSRFKWVVSRSGTGNLTTLNSYNRSPLDSASGIGRFDDTPGTDVLLWRDHLASGIDEHLISLSEGQLGTKDHSRQDMR